MLDRGRVKDLPFKFIRWNVSRINVCEAYARNRLAVCGIASEAERRGLLRGQVNAIGTVYIINGFGLVDFFNLPLGEVMVRNKRTE